MFNIIKGLQIKPQWVTTSDTSELLACLYFFLRDKSACKNVEELLPGYISQWHLKWFVNSLKKKDIELTYDPIILFQSIYQRQC